MSGFPLAVSHKLVFLTQTAALVAVFFFFFQSYPNLVLQRRGGSDTCIMLCRCFDPPLVFIFGLKQANCFL